MVRAVVEIHLVADIEAQADRSEVTLQAAARIQDTVHTIAAQAVHRAEERADRRRRVAQLKVNESALEGDERLNGVMSDVDLGAEFAVQDAQPGTLQW